jgi:hypothetical protein
MKTISAILIATTFILASSSVSAQIPVEKIQPLLDKATGQKYVNITGKEVKITNQNITADTYTFNFSGTAKKSTAWVHEYSGIRWADGFNVFFDPASGNEKLTLFTIKFKNDISFYMHIDGESSNYKSTRSTMEFYILTKDADQIKALIKN